MQKVFPITVLILLVVLVLNFGCASKPERPQGADRDFKISYVLRDAQYRELPGWMNDRHLWAKKNDKKDYKKYRYFISETELIKNRRLCTKSAEVQATAKIAGEITQFIKNSYAQSVQGDQDEEVSSYMEDTLAQEIQSFIVGARVYKSYWEKRQYMVKLGAEEDKTGYICSALVKIPNDTVKRAIKRAEKKLLGNASNPESKKKVSEALKTVEKKFEEL